MKFCILYTNRIFLNIYQILNFTLLDLGHIASNEKDSEYVFVIQKGPNTIVKEKGKKYILIQTEQNNARPGLVKELLYFNPDRVWGFDITNKNEEYLTLGYHPLCEKNINAENQNMDVSLLGCQTKRRIDFFKEKQYKPTFIREYDIDKKILLFKQTKININSHSYHETKFTEWDRISYFLTNKCFFITEELYCPINKIVQYNYSNYDNVINSFINNEKKRIDVSEYLYNEYKTKFDMRNILQEKLQIQ